MVVEGPRPIGDLLHSGAIAKIRSEARKRRLLTASVRAELATAEAAHVVSAHLADDGTLVVGVDSPAWAARLRYSTQELLGRPVRVRVTAPGKAEPRDC